MKPRTRHAESLQPTMRPRSLMSRASLNESWQIPPGPGPNVPRLVMTTIGATAEVDDAIRRVGDLGGSVTLRHAVRATPAATQRRGQSRMEDSRKGWRASDPTTPEPQILRQIAT